MIPEEAAAREAWAAHPDAIAGWHIHHQILWEFLANPITERLDYIRDQKPESEHAVRFARIRPVQVPEFVVKARAAYSKARTAADEAWAAYSKARETYDQARAAYSKARTAYAKAEEAAGPAMLALHATECGCSWKGDIFA